MTADSTFCYITDEIYSDGVFTNSRDFRRGRRKFPIHPFPSFLLYSFPFIPPSRPFYLCPFTLPSPLQSGLFKIQLEFWEGCRLSSMSRGGVPATKAFWHIWSLRKASDNKDLGSCCALNFSLSKTCPMAALFIRL